MGIVRVYKIKCEDGEELEIHEPLGPVGVVTLTISDPSGDKDVSVQVDKRVWEEVR